jgi:hypothetical protein
MLPYLLVGDEITNFGQEMQTYYWPSLSVSKMGMKQNETVSFRT